MSVKDEEVVIDKKVVNPSMSCPDMFSWKLFVDVVRQAWWTNWASDEQTWPQGPFKLCEGANPGPNCCLPGIPNNPGYDAPDNPALHCPYFPGDHKAIAALQGKPRKLGRPIGAHAVFLGRGGLATGLAVLLAKPGEPEPGRVIRQEVGEITVRNKEMFDYIFQNDLYNAQGIAKDNPLSSPLGVFLDDELSEVGYSQSAKGIPDKDWFHGSGGNPSLRALQTDFMWGMPFFAKPLVTPK